MSEENKNNLDFKIKRLKKASGIIGILGLLVLSLVFLFDLSYPNILFSILATISLALIFLSAGMYIAIWFMDISLAYKRKQYFSVAFLFLLALIFIFCKFF
ncbi:hypothetical protein HMPREF3189_01702 [Clostridiales bacterium KA00134]|nr:hypothetical protein HMPREF3189_01702 [Clostridiales bacterium KA00134]